MADMLLPHRPGSPGEIIDDAIKNPPSNRWEWILLISVLGVSVLGWFLRRNNSGYPLAITTPDVEKAKTSPHPSVAASVKMAQEQEIRDAKALTILFPDNQEVKSQIKNLEEKIANARVDFSSNGRAESRIEETQEFKLPEKRSEQ